MLLLLLAVIVGLDATAQVDAYFSSGTFNTPKNEPYVETYLTLVGKSLAAKPIDTKLQNSINVEFKLFKDSALIKVNKYNLMGPTFHSSEKAPSFIDNQRYSLPNGTYEMQLTLSDNYDPTKKPLLIKAPLIVDFNEKELQSSAIQSLESFKKSTSESSITKCGYDLVPYTVNYYPEANKELSFYFEAYNTNVILGENKPFVFFYYLEVNADQSKLDNYGAFKNSKVQK